MYNSDISVELVMYDENDDVTTDVTLCFKREWNITVLKRVYSTADDPEVFF